MKLEISLRFSSFRTNNLSYLFKLIPTLLLKSISNEIYLSLYTDSSQSVVPEPAVPTSPVNLLDSQILCLPHTHQIREAWEWNSETYLPFIKSFDSEACAKFWALPLSQETVECTGHIINTASSLFLYVQRIRAPAQYSNSMRFWISVLQQNLVRDIVWKTVPQLFITMFEIPQASKIHPTRGRVLTNHRSTSSFALLSGIPHDISSILWPLFSSYFLFRASKALNLFLRFFLPKEKVYSRVWFISARSLRKS